MILNSESCDWLSLDIATDPPLTANPTDWEASFDDGPYLPATDLDGYPGWLIAGPDYDGPSTPDHVVGTGTTSVKVRLTVDPVTVVEDAHGIRTV